MMNIRIIAIGKLKEKYWKEAVSEYTKRLGAYCRLSIVELKEAPLPANASKADEAEVKRKEGEAILAEIRQNEYVIALEIDGKQLNSEELAKKVANLGVSGISDIALIIGGSLGLSAKVGQRADFSLSFSKMTFPHQMMRVILLEQIYRSFKINSNEKYHK